MKFWKLTLISTIAFIGVAFSMLYSSCTDDSCLKLKCRNGGTCANEKCKCPTGYEGTQCESYAANRFRGFYKGITQVNQFPPVIDSAVITVVSLPNTISYRRYSRYNDEIIGTVGSNGKVTFNDNNYGGRQIVINVENGKITVDATENPNGKLEQTNFTGTWYSER
jgi:hypothetical protein